MIVQVRLSSVFTDRHPDFGSGDPASVQLPDGAVVSDLLQLLKLPKPQEAVVISNGKVLQPDSLIKNGDRVEIFPVVEGG